jgi:hypothetical protein
MGQKPVMVPFLLGGLKIVCVKGIATPKKMPQSWKAGKYGGNIIEHFHPGFTPFGIFLGAVTY